MVHPMISVQPFEPQHEKTCLWGLRPGRHKPACSATEASESHEIAIIERDIILSRQQTTKALIRLRRCAG